MQSESIQITDPTNHPITLSVIRSVRRTTASLQVTAQGKAVLRIPQAMPVSIATQFAQSHAQWLSRHLQNKIAHPPKPAPINFQTGECVLFLGESYTLRIQKGLPIHAKHNPLTHEFCITVPPPATDTTLLRLTLLQAFMALAKSLFSEILSEALQRSAQNASSTFPRLPQPSKLTIRPTQSRWGSCSTDGHIMLSFYLVQASREAIEFVIFHELCHLLEPRHSPYFYTLLSHYCPNWQRHQLELNQIPSGW